MAHRFDDGLIAEVRLAMVKGVGPLLRRRLGAAFGSASDILRADRGDLRAIRGVGSTVANAIASAPSPDDASAMLRSAEELGIRALMEQSTDYPPGLREIPDPPAVLYCRGDVLPQDVRAVAIVGTRRVSRYGLAQADRFARGLAQAGVCIASGLARGVDGAAHRAALDVGGRTIAALAGGLAKVYPPEHAELAESVARRGALFAEAAPPMPPMSGSFPQRNRIISGLSLAVLVVEAAQRSGALITARHAVEQGRDVFALPGPVDSAQSAGCHRLIQEGAKLVTCVDDVLEEVETLAALRAPSLPHAIEPATPSKAEPQSAPPPEPRWEEPERSVLAAISAESTNIDQLVAQTGLPVERVLAALSLLETGGAVQRVSGVSVRRR